MAASSRAIFAVCALSLASAACDAVELTERDPADLPARGVPVGRYVKTAHDGRPMPVTYSGAAGVERFLAETLWISAAGRFVTRVAWHISPPCCGRSPYYSYYEHTGRVEADGDDKLRYRDDGSFLSRLRRTDTRDVVEVRESMEWGGSGLWRFNATVESPPE